MKIRSSLIRFCKFCKIITRKKKKYIYCSKEQKHKQKQS